MRYFEIVGAVQVPVSVEENEILKMAEEHGAVTDDILDERQREIVRLMVRRGLLLSVRRDDQEAYAPNQDPCLWRI